MLRKPISSITIILVFSLALGSIARDIVLPGIPAMSNELGSSHAAGQFSLSVFMLGFAIGQLICGPLSDTYGRRPVLLWGIIICMFASLLCAASTTLEALLTGRFLQGLGVSAASIVARVIVGDLYQREQAAKVLSRLMGIMALVPPLAPILGSGLLNGFSWRSHYVISTALCLLLLIIIVQSKLVETSRTLSGSLSTLAVVKPIIECFRSAAFIGYLGTASFTFGAMFTCISSVAFIFIELLEVPPVHFGYTYFFIAIGYMIGAMISAKIVTHQGIKRTLGLGVVILIIAVLLWLITAFMEIHHIGLNMLNLSLVFIAGGLTIPNSQAGVFQLFPKSLGVTASILGFVKILTGALSGIIVSHLYDGTILPAALVVAGLAVCATSFYAMLLNAGNIEQE
jgi:DHA1 family bicyclomycin/chloramphenicol resistance-like MFS transporter